MENQALNRRDLETALIEKCWKDPEFKKAVVSDPKGMLERHTGRKLPPEVKIVIHDEDANTLHLTIPPAPNSVAELSDEELEKVAGGTETPVLLIGLGVSLATGVTAGAAVGKVAGGW